MITRWCYLFQHYTEFSPPFFPRLVDWNMDPHQRRMNMGTFSLQLKMKKKTIVLELALKFRQVTGSFLAQPAAAVQDKTHMWTQFNKIIRDTNTHFLNRSQSGLEGMLRQQVGRCLISLAALSAFIKYMRGNGVIGKSLLFPPSASGLPLFP